MAEEPYDHVIYFDNAQKHIDEAAEDCPQIYAVKVPHKSEVATLIQMENPEFKAFLDTLGTNTYVSFLQAMLGKKPSDMYDPTSGIQAKEINIYNEWEAKTATSGTRRALILDWDRTLTQVEGFILTQHAMTSFEDNGIVNYWKNKNMLKDPLPEAVLLEDTLLYLFGGKERLTMIRNWLQSVAEKGIKIIILTNNAGCNFKVFREMGAAVLPSSGQHKFICSGLMFNGNKGDALKSEIQMSKLCPQLEMPVFGEQAWLNNILNQATINAANGGRRTTYKRRRTVKSKRKSSRRLKRKQQR